MPRKIVTFEDIEYCIAIGPKRLMKVQSLQHKQIPSAIRDAALEIAEERGLIDDEGKIDPIEHSKLIDELLPQDNKAEISAALAFETILLCVELKNDKGKWKLMKEEFLDVDMPSIDHVSFLMEEIGAMSTEVAGKANVVDKKKTLISDPLTKPLQKEPLTIVKA
jgi:hypothetical protein